MAVLQVRLDEDLKNKATAVYNELGIDLSTAVRMFLKRSVVEGGIPFSTRINESTLDAILAIEDMRNTSEKNGNSSMTLEEINDEIKKSRLERKKRNKKWSIMLWLIQTSSFLQCLSMIQFQAEY